MKQPQNSSARHLRPIPRNTVVHTPTEEEAKELLAILHENGYKWCNGDSLIEDSDWEWHEKATCYFISSYVEVGTMPDYDGDETNILTLADFKERYCEEKSQPKFKEGDKVVVVTNKYGLKGVAGGVCEITEVLPHGYHLKSLTGEWFATEFDFVPYTEPETKEETMETKELNLCELLREGDIVYSLIDGEGKVELLDENGFRLNTWVFRKDGSLCGCDSSKAKCLIYPSRALYEQYPLDPLKAWSVWQSEQKKAFICIHWGEVDCNGDEEEDYTSNTYFRTFSDRDKCIEEIKAIIEKYSK